jgi:hypothetical protein
MRIEGLVCWKCGADLAMVPQPLARLAECPACRAELHACRLCRHYNPRIEGQCDEDQAEEVRDKTRANFCDYFKPRPGAFQAPDAGRTAAAKARIDDLFGGTAPDSSGSNARDGLDALFGKKGDKQ